MTNTQRLTALLQHKYGLLKQLCELGERQLERIDAGDMSMLMKILAGKQRLLNDLQQVERALDPFRQEAPESRVWSSPQQRELSARLTDECQRLFATIVEQERHAEMRLIVQRDDAQRQLRGMHTAAGACDAYLQDTTVNVSSFDLSTES